MVIVMVNCTRNPPKRAFEKRSASALKTKKKARPTIRWRARWRVDVSSDTPPGEVFKNARK